MSTAEPSTVSVAVEDYAKAIYSLTRGDSATASTTDLAARLGLSAGSVSVMIKRLDASGLVEHVPYRGVRLTPAGQAVALNVIRRHRLIELFLATALDIPWEEVHRYAEALEHAASDELIEIIANKLGDPAFDPHGDPIPSRELLVDEQPTTGLDELTVGQCATFVRVSDSDPEILRYLSELGIAIGDRFEMLGRQPFEGSFEVRIGKRTQALSLGLASALRVRCDADEAT